MAQQPTILISVAESADRPGYGVANGGVKWMENLCKLLRMHDYEAFIVTYDGEYQPWLEDHQRPYLSLAKARDVAEQGPVKWVIPWFIAQAAIDLALKTAGGFYYCECEQAFTLKPYQGRVTTHIPYVKGWAANSRYQQARYMADFGIKPHLLIDSSDRSIWNNDLNMDRNPLMVGFSHEGPHTPMDITFIQDHLTVPDVEWGMIRGTEAEMVQGLRQCNIFLGMNRGKHDLWGEGSPRLQQEAMHAGCIVIAFDVLGNREYLIDGYTGSLVPLNDLDFMVSQLTYILSNPLQAEVIRARSEEFARIVLDVRVQWPIVHRWLEL